MNRFEAFLKALPGNAALIHRPDNKRWLTGYSGEGCLFVSDKVKVIITDFRYVEQAAKQAPDWACIQTGGSRGGVSEVDVIKNLCDEHNISRLCVETDFVTYDAYMNLQNTLTAVELFSLNQLPQELRKVKDEYEIECIRKAAKIADDAFKNLLTMVHAGMTEKQVGRMLEDEMIKLGSDRVAFPTISASGPNGSLPHAIPSDRVIQEGELLTLDFGARVNGYISDMTRTIGFGKISPELRELYERVKVAQKMALDAIRPGMSCREVDKIARDYLDERYPGAFGHSLGHGVGLQVHEFPRLSPASDEVLAVGHAVTVEPGVYIPGLGGCRIEDTVIVTEDGCINTMTATKELVEL